jgi:hypothetical protein
MTILQRLSLKSGGTVDAREAVRNPQNETVLEQAVLISSQLRG